MTTGRNTRAANRLIEELEKIGYTVSGRQIENWTKQGLAPDIPASFAKEIPERIVLYYRELSTIIRPRRDGAGTLTVLAFRGFDDLIDIESFRKDMKALVEIRENQNKSDPTSAAESVVRMTRRRDTPERHAVLQGLRALPAARFDGQTAERTIEKTVDISVLETMGRLQRGEQAGSGDELVGAFKDRAEARFGIAYSPTELQWIAEHISSVTIDDMRKTIDSISDKSVAGRALNIRTVADTARIVYPFFAYLAPIWPSSLSREDIEIGCMIFSCLMLGEFSYLMLDHFQAASIAFMNETDIRPYVPGLRSRA